MQKCQNISIATSLITAVRNIGTDPNSLHSSRKGVKIESRLFPIRKHTQCGVHVVEVKVITCVVCRAILDGETQPGVWYPEERQAIMNRPLLLERASQGCFRFEMNKPPWVIGSSPKRFVMGIYFD